MPRDNVTLSINAPGGIPLSMAGFLLRAVGTAYPGTMMKSTRPGEGVLHLVVPADDYLNPVEVSDDSLDALVPDKDDPDMVTFTSGLGKGGLRMSPPPWLTVLLRTTAQQLLDDHQAPNYVQLTVLDETVGEFRWIVCRPGGADPHELREAAEARVAELEQQLAALASRTGSEAPVS